MTQTSPCLPRHLPSHITAMTSCHYCPMWVIRAAAEETGFQHGLNGRPMAYTGSDENAGQQHALGVVRQCKSHVMHCFNALKIVRLVTACLADFMGAASPDEQVLKA